jgi:hypothetical protein
MGKTKNIQAEALQLINIRMKAKGFRVADLARSLGLSPSAAGKMIESKEMTLERLYNLSVTLEFNFFTALSGFLDLAEPVTEDKERIRELEMENRTLMKVLRPDKQ